MASKWSTIHHTSKNIRFINFRRQVTHLLLYSFWRVAPETTKRLVSKVFFLPRSGDLKPSEITWLEKGRPFQLSVHNHAIQGWCWGNGPAILFAHGWNGRGVQFHHFFAPLLAAGYSVITFDAIAHGRSSGKATNYFEWTDTLRTLLTLPDKFDIQGIVAHSMGASAVINALTKEALAIDSVLIAPALKLKEILVNTFNRYGIPIPIYNSLITGLETRYGYNLNHDNPILLAPKLIAPALIVHDTGDRTAPYADTKDFSRKSDRVSLHTTEGLGHKRILKDKGIVNLVAGHIINRNAEEKNRSTVTASLT